MKKLLVPALMVLSSVAMAQTQGDVDNRPASQKAQDVYVEPTLRMKTTLTTTVTDPKTSQQKVLDVKEKVQVFDHQGQEIQSNVKDAANPNGVAAPATSAPAAPATSAPAAPAAAPIQSAAPAAVPAQSAAPAAQPSRSTYNNKEITDMSRTLQ